MSSYKEKIGSYFFNSKEDNLVNELDNDLKLGSSSYPDKSSNSFFSTVFDEKNNDKNENPDEKTPLIKKKSSNNPFKINNIKFYNPFKESELNDKNPFKESELNNNNPFKESELNPFKESELNDKNPFKESELNDESDEKFEFSEIRNRRREHEEKIRQKILLEQQNEEQDLVSQREELIEERMDGISNLTDDLKTIQSIMDDLNRMTEEQNPYFDTIDNHISTGHVQVKKATKNLVVAKEKQKKNKKWLSYLVGGGIILVGGLGATLGMTLHH